MDGDCRACSLVRRNCYQIDLVLVGQSDQPLPALGEVVQGECIADRVEDLLVGDEVRVAGDVGAQPVEDSRLESRHFCRRSCNLSRLRERTPRRGLFSSFP